MTIDRTRPRATERTEVMERIRDRIILEHKDLLILVINLEIVIVIVIAHLYSALGKCKILSNALYTFMT